MKTAKCPILLSSDTAPVTDHSVPATSATLTQAIVNVTVDVDLTCDLYSARFAIFNFGTAVSNWDHATSLATFLYTCITVPQPTTSRHCAKKPPPLQNESGMYRTKSCRTVKINENYSLSCWCGWGGGRQEAKAEGPARSAPLANPAALLPSCFVWTVVEWVRDAQIIRMTIYNFKFLFLSINDNIVKTTRRLRCACGQAVARVPQRLFVPTVPTTILTTTGK